MRSTADYRPRAGALVTAPNWCARIGTDDIDDAIFWRACRDGNDIGFHICTGGGNQEPRSPLAAVSRPARAGRRAGRSEIPGPVRARCQPALENAPGLGKFLALSLGRADLPDRVRQAKAAARDTLSRSADRQQLVASGGPIRGQD